MYEEGSTIMNYYTKMMVKKQDMTFSLVELTSFSLQLFRIYKSIIPKEKRKAENGNTR